MQSHLAHFAKNHFHAIFDSHLEFLCKMQTASHLTLFQESILLPFFWHTG